MFVHAPFLSQAGQIPVRNQRELDIVYGMHAKEGKLNFKMVIQDPDDSGLAYALILHATRSTCDKVPQIVIEGADTATEVPQFAQGL